MIKFIVVTCFLMHFMACGWTYIGLSWDPSPGSTLEWETTWLEKYGYGARLVRDQEGYFNRRRCAGRAVCKERG